jgi:thioredoxin 1
MDTDGEKNMAADRLGPGKWIWIALAVAVAGVLIARNSTNPPIASETPSRPAAGGIPMMPSEPVAPGQPLPRLVDLGTRTCAPCQLMVSILEDLKKECAGSLEVVSINLREHPDATKAYAIVTTPTQIFYDAEGKELFRHEGFFGRDDILATWKKLGVDVTASAK